MEFGIAHAELKMASTFILKSDSTYEPRQEESVAAMADGTNETPEAWLYNYLTEDENNMVIVFFTNYSDYNLDAVREMQMDDATVTGLSDAGAHVSLIFYAVNPTYQLSYWSRDRSRGEPMPLAHVIHRATRNNAQLFGFNDRELIKQGMKADINVIDYQNLQLGDLRIARDLPAGGARILQDARGYIASLINGVPTRLHDVDTGERPGRLIRSLLGWSARLT